MALLKGPFSEKDALLREWVLANPEGGFASSSIAFASTRKQHGLLVSEKDGSRNLLVPKLEETVTADGRKFSLSTSQYRGALHPDGYTRLLAFSSSPLPTFWYGEGGIVVEKTVFPAGRKNAFGARYAISAGKPFEMEIRPMLNFRRMNGISQGKPGYEMNAGRRSLHAKCNGMEAGLQSDLCEFLPGEELYLDLFYARDSERQFDCAEHCFSPGAFRMEAEGSTEFFIVACEGADRKIGARAAFESALARAKAVAGKGAGWIPPLASACRGFLCRKARRKNGHSRRLPVVFRMGQGQHDFAPGPASLHREACRGEGDAIKIRRADARRAAAGFGCGRGHADLQLG